MPLYEYKCQSCGDVFEIIQKFSDEPLAVHETCGGKVDRLISTSALQFKGSGWYVNDYGKGNSKQPKAESSNGEAKGDSSKSSESSGKSEASGKPDSGKSESSGKPESSSKSEGSSKSESSPKAPAPSPTKSDK